MCVSPTKTRKIACIRQFDGVFVRMCVCLSVYLSICLFLYLSVRLCVDLVIFEHNHFGTNFRIENVHIIILIENREMRVNCFMFYVNGWSLYVCIVCVLE